MLVAQILTGVVLAMHYTADTSLAFQSVEKIMRDVNSGWLLRYMHSNGASMFFIAVYIHIFRGLYYGSYKAPRELLWILGCIIYLLMMATGFMGYVLPWGQMSFWGATVITGFFTAIPLVGDWIQQLLLGGFAVDNPTLNRFFSLHYLLPFMIAGVVVLHVWALHVVGQTNPTGIEVKSKTDTRGLHALRDHQGRVRDGAVLPVLRLFRLLHPELSRPSGQLHRRRSAEDAGAHRAGMVLPAVLRDPARHHLQHRADQLQAWRRAGDVRRDCRAVLRAVARHVEGALGRLPSLVQDVLLAVRGQCHLPRLARLAAGGRHSTYRWRRLSTLYYFAFFIVIMPLLGLIETPRRLPNSITEAVLEKNKGGAGHPVGATASPETKG